MPTATVIEEFNFSPDGRETLTYFPGEYEIVAAYPGPGQVTQLCAEYASRKGYALKDGTSSVFEVETVPLAPPAAQASPKPAAKSASKGKKLPS